MTTAPQYDEIDDVLYDWFSWSRSYRPDIGYGKADPTCRDFRISRQWMEYEELSEQVDYMLQEGVGKVVEPLVFELDVRHRIAIQTAMLNMEAGNMVWKNPRFPQTQAEDYAAAKMILRPRFMAKGLIKGVVNPKIRA